MKDELVEIIVKTAAHNDRVSTYIGGLIGLFAAVNQAIAILSPGGTMSKHVSSSLFNTGLAGSGAVISRQQPLKEAISERLRESGVEVEPRGKVFEPEEYYQDYSYQPYQGDEPTEQEMDEWQSNHY